MFDKRISIFTGHYGSGKTEVAANYSLALLRHSGKVAIVDFDIVNPYFRMADLRSGFERRGIKVITPLFANTNVDVPALPPELYSVFEDKSFRAVFDVGGDDAGAKALSRFRTEIQKDDYEMFFVINARRPMTDTAEKIIEMMRAVEESAGIKVTGLVNNTNLLGETTPSVVMDGHKLIEEVSREISLPVCFISCLEKIAPMLAGLDGLRVLPMAKFVRLPWESQR